MFENSKKNGPVFDDLVRSIAITKIRFVFVTKGDRAINLLPSFFALHEVHERVGAVVDICYQYHIISYHSQYHCITSMNTFLVFCLFEVHRRSCRYHIIVGVIVMTSIKGHYHSLRKNYLAPTMYAEVGTGRDRIVSIFKFLLSCGITVMSPGSYTSPSSQKSGRQ